MNIFLKSKSLLKLNKASLLNVYKQQIRSFADTNVKINEDKSNIDNKEEKNDEANEKFKLIKSYIMAFKNKSGRKIMREHDFEKEIIPVLQTYKELGFKESMISYIFKIRPSNFLKAKTPEENDIYKITEFVKKNYDFDDTFLRCMLFKNPLILRHSIEILTKKLDIFKNSLEMSQVIFLFIIKGSFTYYYFKERN